MASKIRIKRSSSATAPGSGNLLYGELAASFGGGTQANNGERLFIGNASNNPIVIGGEYFTDLLNNAPGVVAAGANASVVTNGFVPILNRDSNGNPGGGGLVNNLPRVDQWSVDKITIDGNTISSNGTGGTSADEDIILRTNGDGHVISPDNQRLTWGDGKDGTVHYDSTANKIMVNGVPWQFNSGIGITGGMTIDNVAISTNTVATNSGSVLYIDPYPDGLSSDGLVVVKGSLQVDGTTTTVNSTASTLNDPVIHLGDITSKLSVMASVASGVSTISVDRIVGINTGDIINVPGLPGAGSTAVTSYVATANAEGNYVITFSGTTTAAISTSTSTNGIGITVTHAYDTNTDRGISFSYNSSSGTANNKTGFFGYNDSAGENSNAPATAWTYIPEVTALVGNVATGVRGMLDIAGLYYQNGGYVADNNDVTYFNDQGKLVGVGGTTAGISTSNWVLTTNAAGVPKWTSTLDGGTY